MQHHDHHPRLATCVQLSGRSIDVSQLTKCEVSAAMAVKRAVADDPATDEELRDLGEVLQATGASAPLITMPPGAAPISLMLQLSDGVWVH